MKSFDEWFLENGIPIDTDFNVASRAYQAGQQSKQAEVDELKRKLNEIVILVRDNTPDYYLDNMIDEILKGENHES